jgi:hypothetical protein
MKRLTRSNRLASLNRLVSLNRFASSHRLVTVASLAMPVLFVLAGSVPAFGQTPSRASDHPQTISARVYGPVSLSGPRFGVTFLGDGIVEKLAEHDIEVGQAVTQFGWQFEKRFYAGASGLTALNEWVVLIGGLDQGTALPSVTWLAGLRTREGAEFGIGPNITPLGFGLAVAAGTTFRAGVLNIPVNIAVVPSKSGMRVSFLTGFNTRH